MPKMVTRTIIQTIVHGEAAGDGKQTLFPVDITIPGKVGEEKAAKVAERIYNNSDHKFIRMISCETNETLYGMDEATFIAHATILPARKNYNKEG